MDARMLAHYLRMAARTYADGAESAPGPVLYFRRMDRWRHADKLARDVERQTHG
jgi:hypothetical protein